MQMSDPVGVIMGRWCPDTACLHFSDWERRQANGLPSPLLHTQTNGSSQGKHNITDTFRYILKKNINARLDGERVRIHYIWWKIWRKRFTCSGA